MKLFVVTVLISVLCCQFTKEDFPRPKSSYKVKVALLHYHNPTSQLIFGKRCELFHFFNDRCDPFADVKIFEKNKLIRQFRTTVHSNRNYIQHIDSFTFEGKELPNQILVRVHLWDSDSDKDELMLRDDKNISLSKDHPTMIEYLNKYAKVTLKFEVLYIHRVTVPETTTAKKSKSAALKAMKSVQEIPKVADNTDSKWTITLVFSLLGVSLVLLLSSIILIRKYNRLKRTTDAVILYNQRNHEEKIFIGENFEKVKIPIDDKNSVDDNIYETTE